jgi:glycosyltransferase involved in cell wall biosynthesis
MLQFPQKLRPNHSFEQNGQRYVVDLEEGVVVEVDAVLWEILKVVESKTTDELLAHLQPLSTDSQVREALKRLDQLSRIGLLVEGALPPKGVGDQKTLQSLFIAPGFLSEMQHLSLTAKLEIYYLLSGLGKEIKVSMAWPIAEIPLNETENLFSLEDIERIDYPTNRTFASTKFIPQGCDGILALSMLSKEDMSFFTQVTRPPLVNRIISDEFVRDSLIHTTLDKSFVFRPYDALCVDASWTREFLMKGKNLQHLFTASENRHSPQLVVIPGGVNHQLFQPGPKGPAKEQLAAAFENPLFMQSPTVLIISGFRPEEGIPFLRKVCDANPELIFLVIDSMLERYMRGKPENVEFFKIESPQDYDALPILLNAVDVGFFPAVLGIPTTCVFAALACGIPMIVAGEDQMPPEVGEAGLFIKIHRDGFGNINVPIELLTQCIHLLIGDGEKRAHLSQNAHRQGLSLTWEATVANLITLFEQLSQAHSPTPQERRFGFKFSYTYDRIDGTIQPRAVQLPSYRQVPMEWALASTLLLDHTPAEVESVLTHICQDKKKALAILDDVLNPGLSSG